MSRILSSTRFAVLLGVVASLALSITLYLAVLVRAVALIAEAATQLGDAKATKLLAVSCIELVDFTLIATALFIVAVGLFELFIADVRLPSWLVITSLDNLKDKLINVVVVVLAVSFLAQVATWDGKTDLLPLGAAIALVIFALTAFGFLRLGNRSHGKPSE